MSRVKRDPERGRAAAAKLKALGVKGILIKAAEQRHITQLACKMPECFCAVAPKRRPDRACRILPEGSNGPAGRCGRPGAGPLAAAYVVAANRACDHDYLPDDLAEAARCRPYRTTRRTC